MSDDQIRGEILRILRNIAPEIDLAAIKPDRNLREQLDLDSMDLLTFVTAIDRELHVAVPESDYRSLSTIDGCVRYLAGRLDATATRRSPE